MKTLKEKILAGEKIVGTHVQLSDPAICEIVGRLGYDYIWVDLEHTYMSYKDLLCHISAAHSAGTPVIVRVPQNDFTVTKKVMEMGPDGIIFPMITSVEQAKALIDYTVYPPYGNRGFGPMGAVGYGYYDTDEYLGQGHLNKTCRFIQIEHKAAVDCLEELAKIEHIDGYIFGPFDLSGSVDKIGKVKDPEVIDLMKHTVKVLHDAGKYVGLSIGAHDEENLKFWSDLGIDMLSSHSDYGSIFESMRETLAILNKVHKNR